MVGSTRPDVYGPVLGEQLGELKTADGYSHTQVHTASQRIFLLFYSAWATAQRGVCNKTIATLKPKMKDSSEKRNIMWLYFRLL